MQPCRISRAGQKRMSRMAPIGFNKLFMMRPP
jgi:hypothetical protein